MPAGPEGVHNGTYNDYSPRMLVLTPAEAWALPADSGKVAYPNSDRPHRLRWTSLASNGHLPDGSVVEHREQILTALSAGRGRRLAEMAAWSAQQQIQERSDIVQTTSETYSRPSAPRPCPPSAAPRGRSTPRSSRAKAGFRAAAASRTTNVCEKPPDSADVAVSTKSTPGSTLR